MTPKGDARSPDARAAARTNEIARLMKDFTPFDTAEPIHAEAPAPADDGTPWLLLALVGAGALAIGTQLHRLRPHRRSAAAA